MGKLTFSTVTQFFGYMLLISIASTRITRRFKMDVLTHIKEEHEAFRKMMSKIETTKGDKKVELFNEFDAKLSGHHKAEETLVFPLVREKVKGKDVEIVLEMIEEHNLGKHQFSVMEKIKPENETWDAKFSVLKEVLEHHMEEEEKIFMPIAKKAIPQEKLGEILEEFEAIHEKAKTIKMEKLDTKH